MKGRNSRVQNPEAEREREEREKAEAFYNGNRQMWATTLYPDEIAGGAVSATGSTGLIQIIPVSDTELESYEEVNSYKQRKPIVREEEK